MKSIATILLSAALAASSYAAGSEIADAAQNRDIDALHTLLKQRADVNAAQPDGTTALHWAAHWNDTEAVNLLLRAGAECEDREPLRRDAAIGSRGYGKRRHDRSASQSRSRRQDLDDRRR